MCIWCRDSPIADSRANILGHVQYVYRPFVTAAVVLAKVVILLMLVHSLSLVLFLFVRASDVALCAISSFASISLRKSKLLALL